MLKAFLETGKIVGTHGIRGTLRVQGWCDSSDFLQQFKYIYTDSSGTEKYEIKTVKSHGNVILIDLKGIDTIEKAETLRNKVIYISRKDVMLPEDRYFVADLIGCTVIDADTEKRLGILTEVSETGANDVWHITEDGQEYLVPAIDEVIISVDVIAEKIVLRPLKGIFNNED